MIASNEKRVRSIDALKGMSLLGIVLLHLSCPVEWAALGVSVFFVSSGFFLERRFEGREVASKRFADCLCFAVNHIKKSYGLHIISMIGMLILCILKETPITKKIFIKLFRDVFLNVFLLQSWWPSVSVNVSLNGVALFLSSVFFCYLMFNWIHDLCVDVKVNYWLAIISVLVIQIIWSFISLIIHPSDDFYRYITYDFPVFRLGDFSIGCFLWHIVRRVNKYSGKLLFSFIEVFTLLLSIMIIAWDKMAIHVTMVSKMLNNWVTIYIPLSCLWIALLYFCKGFISRLVINPIFLWIGRNSLEVFLIHYVVLQWLRYLFILLNYENETIGLIIFLFVTFFLVEITKKKVQMSLK